MSLYSFFGTSFLVEVDDQEAATYNNVMTAFLEAQRDFERKHHGRKWTPDLPLEIDAADADIEIWNRLGSDLCERFNNASPEVKLEEMSSDYLVKM